MNNYSRSSFIPKEAVRQELPDDMPTGTEVWHYEYQRQGKTVFGTVCFTGKAGKPSLNCLYRSENQRAGDIARWLRGITMHQEAIVQRRTDRKTQAPDKLTGEVATIRARIKGECSTLSVRQGKGTAACWVDVRGGTKEDSTFTKPELAAIKRLGLNAGGNFANISPQERANWAKRLQTNPQAKFVSIAGDWD